jgi:hypothetical protein
MDYSTFRKREDFEDYCALFEDSGREHIVGTKRISIFLESIKQGSEEIYSDVDSKAEYRSTRSYVDQYERKPVDNLKDETRRIVR